jgi:hypothetical protein
VLATQETVKLRSDCLHLSTAGQGDDVAGIGTTLFHAFTQRKGLTATDAQINRIPAPFAEIIRNSFARRWTLAQVSNALKPVLPVASVPAAPAPVPTPAPAPPPRVAAPVAPAPPRAAAAPVAPPPPVVRPEPPAPRPPVKTPPIAERLTTPPIPVARTVEVYDEEEPLKRRPFALYGAIAVVVLAILGWLLMRPHSEPAPASAPQATTQPAAPAPAVVEKAPPPKPMAAKPSAGKGPATRPTAAKASPSTPGTPAPGPEGRSIWRVVAYTYKGQTKAEDMVSKINEKHSNLGAEVFSPRSGDYLVTVGGPMDHDQATKMLDKARRAGLPEDSYVQNFSR